MLESVDKKIFKDVLYEVKSPEGSRYFQIIRDLPLSGTNCNHCCFNISCAMDPCRYSLEHHEVEGHRLQCFEGFHYAEISSPVTINEYLKKDLIIPVPFKGRVI